MCSAITLLYLEVRFWLDRSDVDTYLQAAVASGLVSRVVSIWPSWDSGNNGAGYEKTLVHVGWFLPDNSSKQREICVCQVSAGGQRLPINTMQTKPNNKKLLTLGYGQLLKEKKP